MGKENGLRIKARLIIKNYELEERRKKLKYTQIDFAEVVGITLNKYQAIEGLKVKPTEDEARNIALEIGVKVNILFPQGYQKIIDVFSSVPKELVSRYTPPLLEDGYDIKRLEAQIDAKEFVKKNLKTLNPREQKILDMRFGLTNGDTKTLAEVGCEFGVQQERVRQIEGKALEKLRDQEYE